MEEHRRSSLSDGMTTITNADDAEANQGRLTPKEGHDAYLGRDPGLHSSPEEDEDGNASAEDGTGPEATRVSTNLSIAETISLPHELLLVAVVCLAQLYTRKHLSLSLSPIPSSLVMHSRGVTVKPRLKD